MKSNPIIIKKSGLGGRGARVAIPGVFPSTSRFGEQVVKFRINSLDAYIGGGVPVGSICLIRDEYPSNYGNMLLKSFIAEGASHNHRLYIASSEVSPGNFANSLPSIKKPSSTTSADGSEGANAADLKIAWRYAHSQPNQPQSQHDAEQPTFDFSKKVSVEELGGKNLVLSKCYSDEEESPFLLSQCHSPTAGNRILKEILEVVNDLELEGGPPPKNVARIGICHCESEVLSDTSFLLQLRSIVQHTNSCAVISVSDMPYPVNKVNTERLVTAEHYADLVISLSSIVDQKRRNDLGGIDGICSIRKAASNSTLKVFEPPKDIGFLFKKKRLMFHELHLPPEGENTTQREASSSASTSGATCGSRKSIDF